MVQTGTEVQLGQEYSDEVTGFTGTAVERRVSITGHVQVVLERQAINREGSPELDAYIFDEQRLNSV